MDRLWAPWRLAYITATKQPLPDSGSDCFLCHAVRDTHDRDNLLLGRTARSVVVLNRFPYNNGHLLVAPVAHKATLAELSDDELLDLQVTLRKLVGILEKRMTPAGFNIGLNLGRVAGAGLPGHLHWHLVPRWNGDTNFMPVVADTRVISQSLEALYDMLADDCRRVLAAAAVAS
ncbi:MAG: HIT domain-containing protein [Gemmataceae bacterium]|nr:HIT domain-containing protein [Gemmata sp.]MDW8196366.1 HIT domain-containing protein [Gemmataceae bacterium]